MATEAEDRLRLLLAEPIPNGGVDSDTMFTDQAISNLLANSGGDMNLACVEGWTIKMGAAARLVDVSEAGAERSLSQKFKQAKAMVELFQKNVNSATAVAAATYRAKAKVASLRECDIITGTPFSGSSENVREYPIKRFLIPGILG